MDEMTERQRVLNTAARYVAHDRNAQYGTPESNFGMIAQFWSTYLGASIMPHDVAAMMSLMKLARITTSPDKDDNWIDLAGYAACGAEVRPHNETELAEVIARLS
jgi:hypothetical protein